jgi:tetratricopeptide (TPR) repeat protein
MVALLTRVCLVLCLLLGPLTLRAHGPLHEEILRLTADLEKQPNDRELLIQRGELFRVHELFSEARLDWEKAAALQPSDATNDLRLGLVALGTRDTNTAVQLLGRFASRTPTSLPGQLSAAEATRLAADFPASTRYWTAAIALSEEPRPEWFLERARTSEKGSLPVAQILAGLDEGIQRYGPLPALQLKAVELEVGRGQVDAALRRLSAIAERADRKERWLMRRGEVLLAAGRTNEARVEFAAARAALDQLPEKLKRAWIATDLRQQIDTKLASLEAIPKAPPTRP